MAKLKRLTGKAAEMALFPPTKGEMEREVARLVAEFLENGGVVEKCPDRYAYGIFQQ